jgi:hypothetical protein
VDRCFNSGNLRCAAPELHGEPGHFAIAPVDEMGEVDVKQLEAWAMSRGTGQTHEFTQILLDAVAEPNAIGGTQ